MMVAARKVDRKSVRSLKDYENVREEFRAAAMKAKELRRIHVGEHLTFLFENHETTLYQIQEMLRAEKTEDEAHIRHEIETYNEVLGDQGELGCTLLIEIDSPELRQQLLSRWIDLPRALYVRSQTGEKVMATFDSRQVGERRISSVHYLRFRLGDHIPVAVGCAHAELNVETALQPAQTAALCQDLLAR
jgi:hypothetical protein